MHDLGAGDVAGAVGHNALLLPALAFVVAWSVWTLLPAGAAARLHRFGDAAPVLRRAPWAAVLLVVVVVFSALRNVPGSVLAP
jgi:uncharacterized membrane protein SpoIIM required for sporulation